MLTDNPGEVHGRTGQSRGPQTGPSRVAGDGHGHDGGVPSTLQVVVEPGSLIMAGPESPFPR